MTYHYRLTRKIVTRIARDYQSICDARIDMKQTILNAGPSGMDNIVMKQGGDHIVFGWFPAESNNDPFPDFKFVIFDLCAILEDICQSAVEDIFNMIGPDLVHRITVSVDDFKIDHSDVVLELSDIILTVKSANASYKQCMICCESLTIRTLIREIDYDVIMKKLYNLD